MTMLIIWVVYSAIAVLLDVYLCQDPEYAGGSDPIPAMARAVVAFLWPMVLVGLCCSPKERREIEEAVRKRAVAMETAVACAQILRDQQLDADIAEVLDLIEYQKYRVDPWLTLDPHPRGTEQCL